MSHSNEEAGDGAMEPYSSARLQPDSLVSPRSVTALILRTRALVGEWFKIEIEEDHVTGPEGIITEAVVNTFLLAGGDLREAVPFALLEARKSFRNQAHYTEPALNNQRALACEVLARAAVTAIETSSTQGDARVAASGSYVCLSKRFVQLDEDGDKSLPTSALESAVDQNCVLFLSSPEAQSCAEDLWKGKLIQKFASSGMVFFEPHQPSEPSFLGRLDPSRLSVPQYSYYSGLAIHVAFIVIYTMTTLEYTGLDAWEIVLWVFAAGYLLDDMIRWFKMGGLDKIISFWVLVDLLTDALFVTSFVMRVSGWVERDAHKASSYQLLAFQFLSCNAPLLWMQLLKLADGFQYFGVIQIVLLRMLQETAAFFLLLLLTGIGFAQSFFALDAADGRRVKNSVSVVINMLVAGLLGQPDFDAPNGKFGQPFGSILFYLYAFITVMLLANILVAFFSSAYDKTVDDATDVFRAYFCSKVVSSIRAPDQFVYLPPFNIIEAFLIAPFEPIMPTALYARINKYIQGFLFCLPLAGIALYESQIESKLARRIRMEMLDDLPEEKMRRLKEAAGIQGSIQDPSFGKSLPTKAGHPSISLSKDEFCRAAKEYAQLSNDNGKGSVYGKAWRWVEGSNPPHTAHLSRSFTLPGSDKADDGEDARLLDSLAQSEDASRADGTEATNIHGTKAMQVTQSICYSSTWKVPVLYLEAVDTDGSPLSIDALCTSALFLGEGSASTSSNQAAEGLAVFPTVSMGENPGNGHTSAYLHPCETARSIATTLEQEGETSARSILETFIMLCSTVVEMRPGSQGDLSRQGKKLSLKKEVQDSDDVTITTVSFAELMKKLPNVKSEEDEEEDAVTIRDLMHELKSLRSELEKLKNSS